MSPSSAAAPVEILPDPAPPALFYLPNFIRILLACSMEYFDVEDKLESSLPIGAHKYCLFGLGVFGMANIASFLGGSVVLARIEYDVKLSNLYADKRDNKNAVQFNCIQRGHQNFLENFPQTVGLKVSAATAILNSSRDTASHLIASFSLSIDTFYLLHGYYCGTAQYSWLSLVPCRSLSALVCPWLPIAHTAISLGTVCLEHWNELWSFDWIDSLRFRIDE